jgi:predicted PurR-regulated permease PerM
MGLERPSAANGGRRPKWNATLKSVIGVTALVLFAVAFYRFRIVFAPLIIGMVMAYVLQPVVRLISRVTRLPHGFATGIVYVTLLALLIPVIALLTPIVVNQAIFLQRELTRFFTYLDTISTNTIQIMGLTLQVQDIVIQITSSLTDWMTSVAPGSISLVFGLAETVLLVIFTLLAGFYLTRDSDKFIGWFHGIIPYEYRDDFTILLGEIDGIWSAFFRGQLILVIVVGAILTAVSTILGLPQPVLMGVLGGMLEFLPSVGHAIWLITALIVAGLEGSTHLPVNNVIFMVIILITHLAFTQFDLNFLIPNIIGRRIHLHPLVVLLGIIIGASVGGVLGVVLAAPTIASCRVIGRYIYANFFDLDPFPMVGPPAAPRDERLAEANRQEEDLTPTPTDLIRRVRRLHQDDRSSHHTQVGDTGGSE